MTLRSTMGTVMMWAAVTSPMALAENYTLDSSHTAVIFSIAHMQFSFTYGRFNKVEGTFSVDQQNPANSQFQFTIDAASIDSNDAKRDEHLRGPDFFDTKQFPSITFQSTAVTADAGGILNVTGNLTLHGVTQQVTLPMKQLGVGPSPMGDRIGFFLETKLKRSDFGMSGMLKMIGDEVGITISFEGVKQ